MATMAMPAPTADTGSVDTGLTLDSVIDTAYDSTVGTEAPESNLDSPDTEPVTTEQPTQTEPAPVAEPTPVDPNNPYALTEDGSSYVVPKAELPQLQGYKQYTEAVQQRFPTPQDAEAAYLEASDFRSILNDYQFGQDGDVDAIIDFLSGGGATDPLIKQSMRQGFERFATRIPEALSKLNPQTHQSFSNGVMQAHEDALYQKWAASGSDADKQAYQQFAWGRTGQYKTEVQRVDPNVAAQQRLADQQKQIESREAQLLDRDWQSYNKNSVDGPKWAEYNAEIDKMLDPIKASYAPEVFKALRDSVASQLQAKLTQDYEWARNHNNARMQIQKGYEMAWKNRQSADSLAPRVKAYQSDFMARVRMALPSIAKPLIDKAAARPAAAPVAKAKPQQVPQTPNPRAANGQFQQKQGRTGSIMDDPEFDALFRV